jgi:predicted aspartyl protease
MKNLCVYLIAVLVLTSCSTIPKKVQDNKLLTYYKEKNFFKLENLLSKIKFDKSNPDLILYHATVDNVFNKPDESNRLINILLKDYAKYFNDTIVKELYYMRSANAYRLQDYKSAYFNDSVIVNKYRYVCDSSEIETRKDDITIFHTMMDVPKMEINMAENSKIPIKRDRAGLQNLAVTMQNDSVDFVFDTGAEFSVIIESVAKKYGVKMLDGNVRTGTSTSKKVNGHMGLLNIKLGSIELKNVAFLVLPDSLLTFANGLYVIKGIIGFPVMFAFTGFTIVDNEFLMVSQKHLESADKNFAIDGQYIIIRVTAHNDTLPFLFDSGNQTTILSSSYFNRYKTEIIGKCKKEEVVTGGAGGMVKTEAYILDSLTISAGNSRYTLDSIQIYPKDFLGYDMKYLYGNFGQNYISKFSEMRIDFGSMNISFANKKK